MLIYFDYMFNNIILIIIIYNINENKYLDIINNYKTNINDYLVL